MRMKQDTESDESDHLITVMICRKVSFMHVIVIFITVRNSTLNLTYFNLL